MSVYTNTIQLLDVTLRDGGFINQFNFSPEVFERILSTLDSSGVSHIEVGFRNGLMAGLTPQLGTQARCPDDYLMHCRQLIHTAKLTVMFFAHNVEKSDLEAMHHCGVDSIRMCISSNHDLALNIHTIEMAKACGFEVFVNLVFISQWDETALQALVRHLAEYKPKAIYLADSAGHLTPDQIKHVFAVAQEGAAIEFGFHGHDNLFLAQANAFAAIQQGVRYIDATLCGIGRGVGNLRTEGIVSLLRSQGNLQYDVPKLLSLADYVRRSVQQSTHPLPLHAMISGIFNYSEHDLAHLNSTLDLAEYYASVEQYKIQKNRP